MELRQYWFIVRRWWWLVVLATITAAVAAYFFSIHQLPYYRAETRLRVISAGAGANPGMTYTDVLLTERLSRTYAEMIHSEPVLELAYERIGLNYVPEEDLAEITVQPVRDTQLVDIQVEHPLPKVARDLANALPQVFLEYNRQQQASRYAESKSALEKELAQLDAQIRDLEAKTAELDNRGDDTGTEAERMLLENRLAQYRSSYSTVLAQLEALRLAEANATDTIIVVEPARTPRQPVRPRVLLNTLLAAIVGAMLGLGTAFLIEYLDDTVKSPDDVDAAVGLPTLGMVARYKGAKGAQRPLVTVEHPRSPLSEVYRGIRTNVQFSSVDRPIRTLLVTSAGPVEGKSTTAANLAVVMAQAGKRVVLVDADLRRPVQHKTFDVPNNVGLTGALLMERQLDDVDSLLYQTKVPNLKVLTSGQIPPNPSELLGSQKMRQLMERLLRNHDILIFDVPPALVVTDPMVLAKDMDAVMLVVESGKTRQPALRQTLVNLQNVGANVIGVVINMHSLKRAEHYYYYHYYDEYYSSDGAGPEGSRRHKKRRRRSAKAELPS